MRLSDNRYESIKNDVVNMYVDCDISAIPIDVFDLCDRLGYILKPYSSLGMEKSNKIMNLIEDGFHRFENGKVVIYYNDSILEGRIRFTIMHEIGHIIRKHYQYSQLAENEANWFAAYALCPPPIIDKFEINDCDDLISKFNITYDCAYNSMNRYIAWKKRNMPLLEYERKLIQQFGL